MTDSSAAERRAAGERGQGPESLLVVREEQVVAPADRRAQRTATFRLAAGRVAQQREPVVEAAGDLPDPQRPGPRGGELDGQRQPVERTAEVVDLALAPGTGGATGEHPHGVGERERRELDHDLAVELERHLARAEDPGAPVTRRGVALPAPPRRRRRARSCRRQQRLGAPEPLEQRGLAAGHVQCGEHRVEDVVGGLGGLEPDDPHAAERARRGAAGRDRHGRLADPAPGPVISTSRRLRNELGQRGDLAVAADELGQERRQVAGGRRASGAAQPRIVLEDPSLELLQPRSRLEPEVLGEPAPDPLIGGQRVGLAPGAVEGGDEQLPQPLLVRIRRDGALELADHRVAEPQAGREPDLEELDARLLEPGPVRGRPVAGRHQDRPAEACQRLGAELGGAAIVAALEPPRRRRGVAQHAEGVDPAGLDPERVGASALSIASGSPSARRSCATFDCSVLRLTAAPSHSSSRSRSACTGTPASSARRTSTSDVFPAGTARRRPSRLTSTGPSTETSNTTQVYGRRQRAVSAAPAPPRMLVPCRQNRMSSCSAGS